MQRLQLIELHIVDLVATIPMGQGLPELHVLLDNKTQWVLGLN
jgi:hypothetical protein